MLQTFVFNLSRFSSRNPRTILMIAGILSALALTASVNLPVYTSRQALLPQDTEVAKRLNRYLDSFGASSDLVVALENAPRKDLESFATQLAENLRGTPEIAQATDRIDVDFIKSHLYLMIPSDALHEGGQYLESVSSIELSSLGDLLEAGSKIKPEQFEKEKDISIIESGIDAVSSLMNQWQNSIENSALPPTELNFDGVMKAFGAEQLTNGYFASRNGGMLLVFVHARAKGEDFETLQPLNRRIRETAERLSQEFTANGRTAPQFTLTGLPAIEYEEYIDIGKDINLVIWTAVVLIGALIFIVVRSLPWALAIFIPMGLGALWSLGFAYLCIGHLTIITSSFLAILFGLGADYGIFTSSQIAEARRQGKALNEAISSGIAESFPAVATAGGASMLIFGTLATVEFPGFAELGVIAGGGVLLILLSTWMVQPAIYALFPPKIRARPSRQSEKHSRTVINPFLSIVLVALALGTAGMGIMKGQQIGFDYDVLSLLPKDSKAAAYQRRLVEETDYQSEIVIFTAPTLTEITRIAREAEKLKSLTKVQSISPFFPEDSSSRILEAKKLAVLASNQHINENLNQIAANGMDLETQKQFIQLLGQALDFLDDSEEKAFTAGQVSLVGKIENLRSQVLTLIDQSKTDSDRFRAGTERFLRSLIQSIQSGMATLRSWEKATQLEPHDLPDSIRERFLAADGTFAAYGFPAKSVYDPDNLDELMSDVYGVSRDATGFPSTHQVFSKAVVSSFTHGTRLAVIVCLAWLVFALRKPQNIIMAALPLLIGGGWMLGVQSLCGLRYNYANIIALPLVIALAVDYGVWLSHRWSCMGRAGPVALAFDAGRVILLAAGTELAGLGAITLASYRGVSGLGIDITIGLFTCLIATLLVAPAIGQLLNLTRKPH